MTSLLRRPLRSIVPALHQWHHAAFSTTISTRKSRKSSETLDLSESRIAPGSENHHDLPSFLAYAERVDLSSKASVYVGTHYEYTVATTLARLGFKLTRTGRARDYGIDLLGSWTLPVPVPWSANTRAPSETNTAASSDAADSTTRIQPPSRPLRVLLQCKCSNKKLGPDKVRELEGAFTGAPTEWRQEDFLGLLATTNSATKGIIEALGRSRWPMGFLKIEHDGRIEQFLWNRSAQARGLEGLGVIVRYMLPTVEGGAAPPIESNTKAKAKAKKGESETVRTDVGLTWDGMPLPYLKSQDIEALEGLKMDEVELVEAVQAKAEQEGLDLKVKKTRGRKKKSSIGEELDLEQEEPTKPARRGGRKKKDAQPDVEMENEELVDEVQEDGRREAEEDDESPPAASVVKRGPGRPRKLRV
ncbi:uncharacterized protein J3D65DRAFT_618095 [Phyllosticta citribraziliensis]|uniref:Required for respiratory growth protein 7, mitochondrial n=1 Tax=Phyllosticta citribraziliensis TaxID=989973 RepID=A0ABR1LVV0_9PEZI